MDKRDYELLLALDQHKNITKAAQSLYMTQPAITKRIQKMEEELHCPLLIRKNIKYITMKLDENERSTQIRLMKVKDMMLEEKHHYKEKRELCS